MFWSNLIYYPLTHWFEVITLGWVKNFGITDWDWQIETWAIVKVITYNTSRTVEFKSCLVFLLWHEVWLTDMQTGETGKPKGKHVGGSNTFEISYV